MDSLEDRPFTYTLGLRIHYIHSSTDLWFNPQTADRIMLRLAAGVWQVFQEH